VANAILDGTDCVMLSEESAMGEYPLESVQMLTKIAAATEPHRPPRHYDRTLECLSGPVQQASMVDSISRGVENIVYELKKIAAVLAPTASGHTARSLSRFRLPAWVLGVSQSEKTCRDLLFSYGVWPVLEPEHPHDWTELAHGYVREFSLAGNLMIQTEGPSPAHPATNHKMEIIPLATGGKPSSFTGKENR
jgi:pyruvate kinase